MFDISSQFLESAAGTWSESYSPLAGAPAPHVSIVIPTISASVPTRLTLRKDAKKSAALAATLAEMDLGDVDAFTDDITEAQWAEKALQAWVKEKLPHTNIIDPFIHIRDSSEFFDSENSEIDAFYPVFGIDSTYMASFDAIEALEARVPGLGQFTLTCLSECLARVAPVFTPSDAQMHAQHLYWYGEENENLVREEMQDGEYEGLTRDDFDNDYPDWTVTGSPKSVTLASFASAKDADAQECLRLIAALQEAHANPEIETLPFLPEGCEMEPGTYGAILGRKGEVMDALDRIFDDLDQYFAEAGMFTDAHHAFEIDPTNAEAIKGWMRQMEAILALIAAGDKLLMFLKEMTERLPSE